MPNQSSEPIIIGAVHPVLFGTVSAANRRLFSSRRWLVRHLVSMIALLGCVGLTACGPDYVKRFDKPLTYAEAVTNKDIDFPFPASSHDIYFGVYADWQAYTMIARFQAPVQDCVRQIDAVIAWDDHSYHRTSSYPRITITNVAPQGAGWLGSVAWFTPETLTHGIYAGQNSSHTPQIWVDTDKGVFYFMEND